MSTCSFTCVPWCTYMYSHKHMHTLTCTHLCSQELIYTWTYSHTHDIHTHVYTLAHTQISSHTHAHTLMWTHTFTLHFFIFFHLSFCRVQSQIWLSWAFTVLSQNHCLAPQLVPSLTPILVTHRVWSLQSVTSLYSEILSQNKLSNSCGGTGSGQSIHLYI